LVEAQEEERKRISRELHDEAGQGLMALRLHLGSLAAEGKGAVVASKIQQAMSMLDHTIGDLRRIIARLSPRTLNELGLLAAIRKEARSLSKISDIKGTLDLPANLSDVAHEVEVVVYRTVQEALHNIAKHSRAANFSIRLERDPATLILRVEDDGVGFVSKPNFQGSFGLLGMRERLAALGGTVRIRSRQGRGTKIRVMLPLRPVEKISTSQHNVVAGHQQFGQEQHPGKRLKSTVIRGLVKPSAEYSHADQVHSS
jgi:signal transduction histidine kinase